MSAQNAHVIVVVGAGPAGMALANTMAKAGHEVIILNRDIKFGGLGFGKIDFTQSAPGP